MSDITTSKSTSQQALWFLVVGGMAALVHFLVLITVVSNTDITPAWANVMAFLVAFVVSFLGHFYLTFKPTQHAQPSSNDDSTKPAKGYTLKALIKWFASSAAGFIANQSLFVIGLQWFGEAYYMWVWLVVTAIVTVMTFALGKLWAFKS